MNEAQRLGFELGMAKAAMHTGVANRLGDLYPVIPRNLGRLGETVSSPVARLLELLGAKGTSEKIRYAKQMEKIHGLSPGLPHNSFEKFEPEKFAPLKIDTKGLDPYTMAGSETLDKTIRKRSREVLENLGLITAGAGAGAVGTGTALGVGLGMKAHHKEKKK
jgi:hypothetical protein